MARSLTYEEMKGIINEVETSLITSLSEEGGGQIAYMEELDLFTGIKSSLFHQISHITLFDSSEARDEFIDAVVEGILLSLIHNETQAAGLYAVDAVFREYMQSALSSPHTSGQRGHISAVIERLLSILSARKTDSKQLSSTFVSFHDKLSSREMVERYLYKFTQLSLEDIIVDYEVLDVTNLEADIDFPWYEFALDVFNVNIDINESRYFMRLTIDPYYLFAYNVDIPLMMADLNRASRTFILSPLLKYEMDEVAEGVPFFMYLDVWIRDLQDDDNVKLMDNITNKDIIRKINANLRNLTTRIDVISSKQSPDPEKLKRLDVDKKTLQGLKDDVILNNNIAFDVDTNKYLQTLSVLGNFVTVQAKDVIIAGIEGFTSLYPDVSDISSGLHSSRHIETAEGVSTWKLLLDDLKITLGGYTLNDIINLLAEVGITFEREDDEIVDVIVVSLPIDVPSEGEFPEDYGEQPHYHDTDLWIRCNLQLMEDDELAVSVEKHILSGVRGMLLDISKVNVTQDQVESVSTLQAASLERLPPPMMAITVRISHPGDARVEVSEVMSTITDYLDEVRSSVGKELIDFSRMKDVIITSPPSLYPYLITAEKKDIRRSKANVQKAKEILGEGFSPAFPAVEKELTPATVDVYSWDTLQRYLVSYKGTIMRAVEESQDNETMVNLVVNGVISHLCDNIPLYLRANVLREEGVVILKGRLLNSAAGDEFMTASVREGSLFGLQFATLLMEEARAYLPSQSSDPINILKARIQGDVSLTNLSKKTRGILNGFNFLKLVLFDEVDFNSTYTNDLHTIYENFGVEGVRRVIIMELQQLASTNNLRIDPRHIAVLADMMTYQGSFTPLKPSDVVTSDISYMQRAGFESPVDTLLKAVRRGVEDDPVGEFFVIPPYDIFHSDEEARLQTTYIDPFTSSPLGVSMRSIYMGRKDLPLENFIPLLEDMPIEPTTSLVGEWIAHDVTEVTELLSFLGATDVGV